MYVDLAGLARYRQDFGAWARGALLPKDAAAARVRTAKAGAVSFVPVQETPLDVSVDFLFTETPPASGDKGPDNPSTISGVSSVFIRRTDINFLTVPYKRFEIEQANIYVSNGITYTLNADNTITANGTATATSYFALFAEVSANECMPSGTYTIKATGNSGIQLTCYAKNDTILKGATTSDISFILDETTTGRFYYRIASGTVLSNYVLTPQVFYAGVSEDGFSIAPDFSITLPLGNTYYGGTLDVSSGAMTVTWEGVVFDGTENWTLHPDSSGNFIAFVLQPFVPVTSSIYTGGISIIGNSVICSHFANRTSAQEPNSFYISGKNAARFVVKNNTDLYSDLQTFKTWLSQQYASGTPLSLVCALAVPYTVQLSPAEILSLTQSSDYDSRVNTVYTDASAVQVGYLKHPSAASADLRNALVSLGGGV